MEKSLGIEVEWSALHSLVSPNTLAFKEYEDAANSPTFDNIFKIPPAPRLDLEPFTPYTKKRIRVDKQSSHYKELKAFMLAFYIRKPAEAAERLLDAFCDEGFSGTHTEIAKMGLPITIYTARYGLHPVFAACIQAELRRRAILKAHQEQDQNDEADDAQL